MGKHVYYFAMANAMTAPHRFSDDVALTKAKNKKEAIKNFRQLYNYTDEEFKKCVHKIKKITSDPIVLTDY